MPNKSTMQTAQPQYRAYRSLVCEQVRGFNLWHVATLMVPTSIPLRKGKAPEGTKWITVHPNGKENKGVPVLIRESASEPGVYYIVGGAGGRMNHLKLTGVKTKAEYEQIAKERRKSKRAEKKVQEKKLAEAGLLDAQKATNEAIDQAFQDAEKSRIQAKLRDILPFLKNVDPSKYEWKVTDEMEERGLRPGTAAYGMAEYNFYRKIETQLDRLLDERSQRFLESEEERVRAGIGAFALVKKHRTDEVADAQEKVKQIEEMIRTNDLLFSHPGEDGKFADEVEEYQEKRTEYLAQLTETKQFIDEALSADPTIDDLAGNKTKAGKGYAEQSRDEAVQTLIADGTLTPENLAQLAENDRAGDSILDGVQGLAGMSEGFGLAQEDMEKRKQLLADAAELSAKGKHDKALQKWKKAEAIVEKWEERIDRAATKEDPAEYLMNVAAIVDEARTNMRILGEVTKSGATAVPDDLKQAHVEYEDHRQLMAVRKKHDALRAGQAKKKDQLKDQAAENGYKVAGSELGDQFHVDELSDEQSMLNAEEETRALLQAKINGSLLREAEQSSELMQQLDLSPEAYQAAIAKHIGTGAFTAFANLSMLAAGDLLMDRRAIDIFGVKSASSILATHLANSLPADKLQAITEGLESYHAETAVQQAGDALADAQAAYDEAKQIAFGEIQDATDPIAMQYLNDQRRAVLEGAMNTLGRSIGQLRAQAELIAALKTQQNPKNRTNGATINMEDAALDSIIQQMAAIGLSRTDYSIERDDETKRRRVEIRPEAIAKICQSDLTPADLEHMAQGKAIKNGEHDQSAWLPHGIAQRPASSFDSDTPEPPRFAISPDFMGLSGQDLEDHVADYIGSHIADGWPVETVLGDLRSASFAAQHLDPFNPDQQTEVDAALSRLVPQFDASQDYTAESLAEYQQQREQAGQALAERFRKARGLSADTLHTQGLAQGPHTIEALHRALAAQPAAVVAFKPTVELTASEKNALRQFFWKKVSPEGREASVAAKKEHQARKDAAKAPETDGMMSMFGDDEIAGPDPRLTQKYSEHDTIEIEDWTGTKRTVNAREWQKQQREWLSAPDSIYGEDDGADAQLETAARDAWGRYLQAHGNNQDTAYRSIQEHLKGEFAQHFSKTYSRLSGQPIKQSKVALTMGQAHAVGISPADQYQQRLEQMNNPMAREMADVGRGSSGKFVSGARREAAEAGLRIKGEDQRALFQDTEAEKGEAAPMRTTLGDRVEGQLASMIGAVADRWNPKSDPVGLFPVSMGDDSPKGQKFYKQQRAVKFIEHQKRVGLWFGAGSGKSLTSIAAFTHLNGQGKAKRGIFAVPSVVQKQFGGEALRFLDPATKREGRTGWKWHAQPGASQKERFAAYQGQDTDFVVVTHQTIRDDTITAIASHLGLDRGAATRKFNAMPRTERAKAVKAAFDHMGWHNLDYLYVDEAHYTVNRKGKENSTMANVLDAIGDNVSHQVLGTGTPVKNDASEAFDYLSKLDPARFNDRGTFLRQFGADTPAHREALQRLTQRYFYADRVPPEKEAKPVPTDLRMTPHQRSEYKQVQDAFNKIKILRKEAKRTKSDINPDQLVANMKILSPGSFRDLPEDQHLDKALELLPAAGAIKEASFNRVVNGGKFETNAKFQHIAKLADQYRAQGKPGVVFARNLDAVAELERGLKEAGHRVATLTGAMTGEDKYKAKIAFSPDVDKADVEKYATADILILSDAGNTGLNLQRGKWLAHVDTPLTSPVKEQRDARIHRLGQEDQVDIHQLFTDSPFDGTARRRLERKAMGSQVWQDPSHSLDDSGLAAHINSAWQRQKQKTSAAVQTMKMMPTATNKEDPEVQQRRRAAAAKVSALQETNKQERRAKRGSPKLTVSQPRS